MNKFTQFLVLLTAGSFLLTACGQNATPTPQNPNPTAGITPVQTLVITQDMNGKTFNLKVGDTFEIQMPTIPTPGYQWEPKDLDKIILVQVGDTLYTVGTSPNEAGGIVKLDFKAVGTGTTSLHLIYTQSTTAGTPALNSQSFGVTIEVK